MYIYLLNQNKCIFIRGRPFDFWGGLVWVIAEKILSQTVFLHWKKNEFFMAFYPGKKHLTPLFVGEKITSTRGLEKKILPKPNHPYPASKVNWSAHYPRDDVKQTNKNKPRSSSKQINPWRENKYVFFDTRSESSILHVTESHNCAK